MAEKSSVAVTIRGKEFRIRTDSDAAQLQRVAALLDQALAKVERKTGTVDSLDVALLTGLNLARELIELVADGVIDRMSRADTGLGGIRIWLRARLFLRCRIRRVPVCA